MTKVKKGDWVLFETEEGPVCGKVADADKDTVEVVCLIPSSRGIGAESILVSKSQIIAKQIGFWRKRWESVDGSDSEEESGVDQTESAINFATGGDDD